MDSVGKQNSILKKISAVIVLITALVFLSFNVFADTPVQPLQVITYSDTTTNVRISGTAERLHYNVDSFQVVFMNPPNNYGTACTPVLVSFRFYNSSDLPAYVGQAEFELTATTGTGAVNTIIYGYDQISTDLFVAESSYSTAEVGRIGIGASNDFAYYTGFVIPPRTSLYFSCIVYVNASAYGQNNTGATEDVNQVTLSSLNLYTNQLSFSADYPYHNQPIDFTDIIDAITDLSDTVSTSSEMQDIINLLTYTGGTYTPNNTSSAYVQNIDSTYELTDVTMYVSRYIGPSYYLSNDIEIDNGNDTIVQTGTRVIPVIYRIVFSNESSKYLRLRYTNSINEFFPSGSYSYEITTIQNDMMYGFLSNGLPTSATNRRCHYYVRDTIGNYGYIAPKTRDVTIIYMNVYVNDTGSVSWGNPTLRFTADPTLVDNVYHPNTVYQLLLDWFNSYKSVNGVDDSSDISDDVADVSDSNHVIEENYYSANASAIEATGLSNYRFSNEQNNGIGQVSTDFMLLWNALGSWNGVYIFSLTMALATFIMRHGGLFTIKRETSDKGGDGD